MTSEIVQEDYQRNVRLISMINNIDTEITKMYENLEKNDSLSEREKKDIIANIETLQNTKQNLYSSLNDQYNSLQMNAVESRNSLVNNTAVSNIIKNQIQNSKKNMNILNKERYNKLRMAEINDYYSDKYAAQSSIMKTIVYFCVPILILGILMKKELLSKNISLGIITALIVICIIVIFMKVTDIMSRSNMVFDEYDFSFNPESVENVSSDSNDDDQPSIFDNVLGCSSENCCPPGNDFGTVWDSSIKKCVTPEYEDTHTEGFVGTRCLQSTFSKNTFNSNIFKNNSSVKGFGMEENYAKF